MLIKITESCHAGCIHCLSDCKPCDNHMGIDTFVDALKFCIKYDNNPLGNIIAGGEPTENPMFKEFIEIYYSIYDDNNICVVATNGHWILENQETVLDMLKRHSHLFFQVTYDPRYYPKKLDTTKRILREERIGGVCQVDYIYPLGRAVENNIPKSDKITVPKCLNVKLVAAQMQDKGLKDIIHYLRTELIHAQCSPSINYDGSIAFGESNLCPRLCNIYDDEQTIINAIINNKCEKCSEYLDKDKMEFYKKVIDEFSNGIL